MIRKVIGERQTAASANGFVRIPLLILTLLIVRPACAELLSLNDPVHGPGAITRDTATGLEWLDLNLTTNRSIEYVTSQFDIGGEFVGFRYANESELIHLWEHAGIPNIDGDSAANIGPAEALMDLIGATEISSDGRPIAFGTYDANPFFSPVAALQSYLFTLLRDGVVVNQFRLMSADLVYTQVLPISHSPTYGNYLVRIVPEPPSEALLCVFGIVAVSFTIRLPRHFHLRLSAVRLD